MANVRGPGLTVMTPVLDRMRESQYADHHDGCPRPARHHQDNVSVRVDAVVYFRVVDAVKAVVNVQNYRSPSSRSRRPR